MTLKTHHIKAPIILVMGALATHHRRRKDSIVFLIYNLKNYIKNIERIVLDLKRKIVNKMLRSIISTYFSENSRLQISLKLKMR